METHRAYCAALDREVRVILRPIGADDAEPGGAVVPSIMCVERSEACCGVRCPLERLARSQRQPWLRPWT